MPIPVEPKTPQTSGFPPVPVIKQLQRTKTTAPHTPGSLATPFATPRREITPSGVVAGGISTTAHGETLLQRIARLTAAGLPLGPADLQAAATLIKAVSTPVYQPGLDRGLDAFAQINLRPVTTTTTASGSGGGGGGTGYAVSGGGYYGGSGGNSLISAYGFNYGLVNWRI